jgi:hypothetical protein
MPSSFTMMDMWREKRKARRKTRGSRVPLQGSFLAAGFCFLAMFASYAERGPDGKPAFARVDAALSGPWARFHVDSTPPGTEKWDATLRRRLHDESPPPFAPPASPAPPTATCGSAFKVSDDTGFPDLWETKKTGDENLRMAFFQARRIRHASPHIPPGPRAAVLPPPGSTCALHPTPSVRSFSSSSSPSSDWPSSATTTSWPRWRPSSTTSSSRSAAPPLPPLPPLPPPPPPVPTCLLPCTHILPPPHPPFHPPLHARL